MQLLEKHWGQLFDHLLNCFRTLFVRTLGFCIPGKFLALNRGKEIKKHTRMGLKDDFKPIKTNLIRYLILLKFLNNSIKTFIVDVRAQLFYFQL